MLKSFPPSPFPPRGKSPPDKSVFSLGYPAVFHWLWLVVLLGILLLAAFQRLVPLLAATVFLLALPLVAYLWSRRALRGVSIGLSLDRQRVFPGEKVELTLEVSNRQAVLLPWLEAEVEIPYRLAEGKPSPSRYSTSRPRWVSALAPGQALAWKHIFEARARGEYRLATVRARSGDAFGLFPREKVFPPTGTLLVYPRIFPLEKLGLPLKALLGEKAAPRSLYEDTSRVAGAREYRSDDPWKRIHWMASAAHGQLQTRQYESSTSLSLLLVLDVHSFPEEDEVFERAVSTAASLAYEAQRQGFALGLLANSEPGIRIPLGSGRNQLLLLLEALARVAPRPSIALPGFMDSCRPHLPLGATMVAVSRDRTPALAGLARQMEQRGHSLLCVTTGDDPGQRPVAITLDPEGGMKPSRLVALAYLSIMGMELSYLLMAASVMLSARGYIIVAILSLYPVAMFSRLAIRRSFLAGRLALFLQVGLVGLVGLAAIGERVGDTLAAGVDFFGITLRLLFIGLVWWLGHTAAAERPNYTNIAFRFQMGTLAVLVLSPVGGMSLLPVFLFFLLSLVALSGSRWAASLSTGAAVLRPLPLRHVMLAGAAVFVPGSALLLALSPEVARIIVGWLGNILQNLSDWLDSQHRAAATTPTQGVDLSCGIKFRPDTSDTAPPPTPMGDGEPIVISPVVFWLMAFALFLGLLVIIALVLRKANARHREHPEAPFIRFEVRKVSLNLLRGMLNFFPRMLRMLWRGLVSMIRRLDAWRKRPRKPAEEPLVSIRALYRHLLLWSARQGLAREPSQTPSEHLELLRGRFPLHRGELERIGEMYLRARYSPQAPTESEFDSVKQAWQRLASYHTPSRLRV